MSIARTLTILLGGMLAMAGAARAAGGDEPLGLYVFMNHIALPTFDDFYATALSKPYVDGAAVEMEWSAIEPQPGVYDWSQLDRWAKTTLELNKKLSLGVSAGIFSPPWLFDAGYGIPYAGFRFNRNARGTACADIRLPLPWSPAYQHEYAAMMSALSRHLHELKVPGHPQSAYDAVTVVKLSGINLNSSELKLDTTAPDDGPCRQSDAAVVWEKAGFTPGKLMKAWVALSEATNMAFPDKILSLQIIHRNGLPGGDRRAAKPDPITQRILESTVTAYGHRAMVQWNALSQFVLPPEIVQAGGRGARLGWQMNGFLGPRGGSGCVYPPFILAACKTMADFQSIMDKGAEVGGRYIEIQAPNTTDNHDPAFVAAHDKLWKRSSSPPSVDNALRH